MDMLYFAPLKETRLHLSHTYLLGQQSTIGEETIGCYNKKVLKTFQSISFRLHSVLSFLNEGHELLHINEVLHIFLNKTLI